MLLYRCCMVVSNTPFPTGRFVVDLIRDRALLAQNPDMVTVVSQEGSFLQQNPSSVGFYGYEAANVVKQRGSRARRCFWDMLFGDD